MKCKDEKGFTLVEVIVATFIFVLAAAIIGSFLMNITRMNFKSNRHTQAVTIANNKLEELLNAGYESPLLAEGEFENPLNPITANGDTGGIFYHNWFIEDSTPIPTSKRIISEVIWDGVDGKEKIVTLTALCIEDVE